MSAQGETLGKSGTQDPHEAEPSPAPPLLPPGPSIPKVECAGSARKRVPWVHWEGVTGESLASLRIGNFLSSVYWVRFPYIVAGNAPWRKGGHGR